MRVQAKGKKELGRFIISIVTSFKRMTFVECDHNMIVVFMTSCKIT